MELISFSVFLKAAVSAPRQILLLFNQSFRLSLSSFESHLSLDYPGFSALDI